MNQMEIFSNQEFGSIRTFEQDGKVLFCGKDIAKALGYQRTADAITAHCKGVCVLPTPSNGGIQRMKFIPEGDVYRLIVHSKLPSAERFERWVFDEVLPSIRKHGAYITREKLWEVATSPEAMMKLCSDLLACGWRSISRARTPKSIATAWSMVLPAGEPMRTSLLTSTRCSRTM